jgi:hypothetical protein
MFIAGNWSGIVIYRELSMPKLLNQSRNNKSKTNNEQTKVDNA